MSRDVEELFEGGRAAEPRVKWVLGVLISGLVLTLLGMACTAVPGGLVTLAGWNALQKEIDRVDSGYLPIEHRPMLQRLQILAWASLGIVVACFIAQGVLLCLGFYTTLWGLALEALGPLAVLILSTWGG
ncbi:MAG: hypothetical protein EA397_08155 [Deltaproteobacteria bacterium]|nr:MAG: hypothetical protein EA397_08155 [Deltaproteobacteria bacterium]